MYKCEKCNYISTDLNLSNINNLCPNCNAPGPRTIFPRVDAHVFIKMINKYFSVEKDNKINLFMEILGQLIMTVIKKH